MTPASAHTRHTAHRRTKVESNSGSGGNDEGFKHKAARVGHDILLQLLVLRILVLQ